jgi:hypothetical protein
MRRVVYTTMEKFPAYLTPENVDSYSGIYRDRLTSMMRDEISLLLLSRMTDNEYYAIDIFARANNCQNYDMSVIIADIREELETIGWKTELSFADTGLFIFSGDRPTSCW